jgi:hypothetical protein
MSKFLKVLLWSVIGTVLFFGSCIVLSQMMPEFYNRNLRDIYTIGFDVLFLSWVIFINSLPIVLVIAIIYRLFKGVN